MKNIFSMIIVAALCSICVSPSFAGEKIFDFTALQKTENNISDKETITVKLSGKINHFGNPDYHAIVPGVHVWIAEYPFTKGANVLSDENGWWAFSIKKIRGSEIHISFIYEKSGWATTKSNVLTIGDKDDLDIAIQFVDPAYYYDAMKPKVEGMLRLVAPKSGGKMKNAMVATVGKNWASMHDDRLPHGDPEATVTTISDAVGPIYFNEKVQPDPMFKKTSVDGGVVWFNVPPGEHIVTARREGVEYAAVKFIIEDGSSGNNVELYIASPPDSIIGTNISGPGDKSIASEISTSESNTEKPTPESAIASQRQLIIDGDTARLKEHFTERLQDRITDVIVNEARAEMNNYSMEDLVATVDISEDGKQAKIHMANGRALTTLLWNGEKWLADTIWFH